MKRLYLLFIACIVILGCGGSHHSQNLAVLDELKLAPTELDHDGSQIQLGAGLNRDFFPGSPHDDSRLDGTIHLIVTPASQSLPLTPDFVWVINGDSVWQTEAQEVADHPGWWDFGHGPKWDTGILVDVVARLVDNHGNVYLIKQTGVTIERSE